MVQGPVASLQGTAQVSPQDRSRENAAETHRQLTRQHTTLDGLVPGPHTIRYTRRRLRAEERRTRMLQRSRTTVNRSENCDALNLRASTAPGFFEH